MEVLKKVFKAGRIKSKEGKGLVVLCFEDIDFVCGSGGKSLEVMYAFLAEVD